MVEHAGGGRSPSGRGLAVRVGERTLPLPRGSRATPGQRVRVGLRPLDIDVLPGGGGGDGSVGTARRSPSRRTAAVAATAPRGAIVRGLLEGELEFLENTGAESHVHVKVAGDDVLRAVSPERLRLSPTASAIALRVAPGEDCTCSTPKSEQRVG